MGRVLFPQGQQKVWIEVLLKETGLTASCLASLCKVNRRTFSDWRTGKFSIHQRVFEKLCKEFNLVRPKDIKIVTDDWNVSEAARKGGLRRFELYGPLGTAESCRRGGLTTQQRIRENPEKYLALGCKLRKNFKKLTKHKNLAELVGIILGDGGINKSQVEIALNRNDDRAYAKYVKELLSLICGETPSVKERKFDNTIRIVINGMDFVERLEEVGLKRGNKIKNQVDIPGWILRKREFEKACVKGLMDTDGSFYSYRPTNRKRGKNFAICFRNYSKPLIFSMSKVLSKLKISHTIGDKRINIYSKAAIQNYFEIIGSSNTKHRRKYYKYFE